MQIDPYLSFCLKLNSKWIKDLNIKAYMEEKVGNNLEHTGTGDNFLNSTQIAQALRSITYKWDLMNLKICKAKDSIHRTKWQPTDWERFLTNPSKS